MLSCECSIRDSSNLDGTDRLGAWGIRLPGCPDMACLRPREYLVHGIALGGGQGIDSTPDVPRDWSCRVVS